MDTNPNKKSWKNEINLLDRIRTKNMDRIGSENQEEQTTIIIKGESKIGKSKSGFGVKHKSK